MAAEKKTLIITLSGASLLIAGVFLFTQLVPINIAANSYLLVQNAQAEEGTPYLVGKATFEEFSGATIDHDYDNRNLLAMAESEPGTDELPEYMPGEVLVQYKTIQGNELTADAVQEQSAITADQLGLTIITQDVRSGVVHFKKPEADVEALVEELKQNPNVDIAQPNYIYTLQSDYTPWGVGTNGDGLGDSGVNADWVWKEGITGDGVVVAVVDSGVDYNHEDLKDNIWQNKDEICDNGIDDDNNGRTDDCRGWDFFSSKDADYIYQDNDPMDYSGHGSHIAGTIAGQQNNVGLVGIAPGAKIMIAKGFSDYGEEARINTPFGTTGTLTLALQYAIANGADVINMSYGNSTHDPIHKAHLDLATESGIILTGSAGNGGNDGNEINYPSAYENVIAVGAVDKNDIVAYFSQHGDWIDIVAPGVEVASAVPSSYLLNDNGSEDPPAGIISIGSGKYASWNGTSMAAPHVAGVAALLLEQNPNLTPAEVKNILTSSAKDLGTPGKDDFYGYGLVDAYAAYLAAAENTPTSTPTPTPLPLDNGEIPAINGEIIVWQGTVFAATKNIRLDSMLFENTGTATNAHIDKYTLFKKNGKNSFSPLLQGGGGTSNGDADIDLLEDVTIDAGKSLELVLTADIATGAEAGKTIILTGTAQVWEIEEPTPTPTPEEPGTVTFSIDSSARDVSPGTDNVEFGILSITNSGEPIELQPGLTLLGQEDIDNATDITDIRLVNAETGATFMGPLDPDASGNIIFSDQKIIESDDSLILLIQGDIDTQAEAGDQYSFILDMTSINVMGVESGNGTESFDIKPSQNPSTAVHTVAAPSITFSPRNLNGGNLIRNEESVVVWEGWVMANNVKNLFIRQLSFINNGTAIDSDIESYSLFRRDGNVLTPLETGAIPTTAGGVTFSDLDEGSTSNGISVPTGDVFILALTADIAPAPNKASTLDLALDLTPIENIDVEDEDGDFAVVTNTEDVDSEATFTIVGQGSLSATTLYENPGEIILAGSEDAWVVEFAISAKNEDIGVDNLTLQINELNTTGFYTDELLQPDVSNDSDAIDKVSLFYSRDGTAVKKTSGQDATVSSFNADDQALFQDLDLIIEENQQILIEARFAFREADDQSATGTARSGHAIAASLDLNSDKSTIRGIDSGVILQEDDIEVDNEDTETTALSNRSFIFNNKVIAKASANQPGGILSTKNDSELLRFDVDYLGDNSNGPFLHQVIVTIDAKGGACIGTESSCSGGNVYLYNGDNELIASRWSIGNGSLIHVLTVGTDEVGIGGLSANIVPDAGALDLSADPIAVNGETYTIRADMFTDGADDAIAATIAVNATGFGQDGIIWIDGGSTGSDGLAVQWIDLGSASSVTEITNTLSN